MSSNPFHKHTYKKIECDKTFLYECGCGASFRVFKDDDENDMLGQTLEY